MTEFSEINDLLIELIETFKPGQKKFSKRAREIVKEISDYAVKTKFFRENQGRCDLLNGMTAYQMYVYMLNRVVNAPSWFHINRSVILIMPFMREKLKLEKEVEENV